MPLDCAAFHSLLMQNHFSEEQKDRYEAFRRSGIKTASVRRVSVSLEGS